MKIQISLSALGSEELPRIAATDQVPLSQVRLRQVFLKKEVPRLRLQIQDANRQSDTDYARELAEHLDTILRQIDDLNRLRSQADRARYNAYVVEYNKSAT